MATSPAPPPPTSLQLRRISLSRQFHFITSPYLHLGFSRRRRRCHLVVASAPKGGPGSSNGQSFTGAGDDSNGKSNKDGRLGGIIGVGLAGVFFVAGITFASISLSKRHASGIKPQMEPLTTEQATLINCNDIQVKGEMEKDGNPGLEGKESKTLDSKSECDSRTDKDLSSKEINGDATEGRVENITQEKVLPQENDLDSYVVDDIPEIPHQNDTLHDDSNTPINTGSDSDLPKVRANEEAGFSSEDSRIDDMQHMSTPDMQEEPSAQDVNMDTLFEDESSAGTFPTVDSSQSQNEVFSPETDELDPSLELPASDSETLPASVTILETSYSLNQLGFKDVIETEASISVGHDNYDIDQLQLPNVASTLTPVTHVAVEPLESVLNADPKQEVEFSFEPFSSIENEQKVTESWPGIVSSKKEYQASNGNVEYSNTKTDRSSLFGSLHSEESFSTRGIPAPSLVSAASHVSPGKVIVPAAVDQIQGQAVAALQALKVIEADVQPGDLCTRREYARWLLSASGAISRNSILKVYPAMYIENITELAFDDVTPEDPDFPSIQGLAEAGLISSKLTSSDSNSNSERQDSVLFLPDSPLSRQDLVTWKMALEKRLLPEVIKNYLYQCSGYIDIDNISPDAWPALVADLSAGDQSISALAFGYTRLFQPNKPVTKAQAAIALSTGDATEVVSEELTRIEAESLAESAVNAHTALVAQVEKDINASFEKELVKEREKVDALEKLANEARMELEKLRAEREEESNDLIRGRFAVESEMEVLSRLRHEVEEELQNVTSEKVKISFEKDRIEKLHQQAESENQVISQLQYELEVERKALSMARAWAEEEAKRAREQAKALEEARERWERRGIKVVVDEDLQSDADGGVTWVTAGEQQPSDEGTISRAENLVTKLKAMAAELKLRSSSAISNIIRKIIYLISSLKQRACEVPQHVRTARDAVLAKSKELSTKTSETFQGFQQKATEFTANAGDKTRRAAEDCKEKITQKFKTQKTS